MPVLKLVDTKLFVDINPVTNNSALVIPVALNDPELILVETKLFTVLLETWSVPELILVDTKLFTVLLDAWSVPELILVETKLGIVLLDKASVPIVIFVVTKLFVDINPVTNNY